MSVSDEMSAVRSTTKGVEPEMSAVRSTTKGVEPNSSSIARFGYKKASAKLLILQRFFKWCPEAESNHRHRDFQSLALPTELSGRTQIESQN